MKSQDLFNTMNKTDKRVAGELEPQRKGMRAHTAEVGVFPDDGVVSQHKPGACSLTPMQKAEDRAGSRTYGH